MPTYDYICENDKCKNEWEVDQKMKDPKITECPKCKELKAKRLISKTSFQLIGSGWGADNYASKK